MSSNADAQAALQQDSAPAGPFLAPPAAAGNVYQAAAVCGVLLLAVGLVFGRAVWYEFIEMDDSLDVYENPHITGGLTAEDVRWALVNRHAGVWMPSTWISHMLDCQVYGLAPGGHHLTNVLLHAATAVLLFLVLRQMTRRLWPGAFVAAVFALHPLRVESVAWVTERKDLLSGLFFMLALAAYVSYVRHRFSLVSLARYMAVIVFFVLGLTAKPMLVTLPFVLLLLDYWPLGRWNAPVTKCSDPGEMETETTTSEAAPQRRQDAPAALRWRLRTTTRLLLEKVPLLAVTALSCVMTVWAYGSYGVELFEQQFSWSWRIGNALVSYVGYLGMLFYPVRLALPYTSASLDLPLPKVLGAVGLLVVLTLVAVATRRKHPYLLVGWLWYLGMLVPVIGIIGFGLQVMGDRFTYLPQIGLCLALTWGLADTLRSWPLRRVVCPFFAVLLLAVLMGCTRHQMSFWRDNVTLWNHTLACTSRNTLAHLCLGNTFVHLGQMDKAINQYQAAIAIDPDYALSHCNLGIALASLGRLEEAIEEYQRTLNLQPNNALAHNNLAHSLSIQGRFDLAMSHCREALRIDPRLAEAHFNIANICYCRGRFDEAIQEYQQALGVNPDLAIVHYPLARALAERGRLDEAIAEYGKALETKSECDCDIHNSLGLALAARGRTEEAAEHFRSALTIRPDFIEAQRNLKWVSQ